MGISPCSKTDAVWSIPSSPYPRAFGSQPRPNSRGLFSGPSPPPGRTGACGWSPYYRRGHLLIPWSHDPNVSVFAKAEETRDCFLMYTLKWWMTLALNKSWNSGTCIWLQYIIDITLSLLLVVLRARSMSICVRIPSCNAPDIRRWWFIFIYIYISTLYHIFHLLMDLNYEVQNRYCNWTLLPIYQHDTYCLRTFSRYGLPQSPWDQPRTRRADSEILCSGEWWPLGLSCESQIKGTLAIPKFLEIRLFSSALLS